MPKPKTRKQKRSPRWFWFQIILEGVEDPIEIRQSMTFDGAILFGDGLCVKYPNFQTIFLIDGKLSQADLAAPPRSAIWNTWESKPFRENGRDCVAFNPLEQIFGRAASTAKQL